MADESTPEALRTRVGGYIRTLYVDDTIYIYENRLSEMYQIFCLVNEHWEWCCSGRIGAFHKMTPLLRRAGVEIEIVT